MCLLAILLGAGCATAPKTPATSRRFDFKTDTFAYANQLKWEYHIDPVTGKQTTTRRDPPPEYSLHCFVVARSTRQFFEHAKFDPQSPKVDEKEYRRLIDKVVHRSPRRESPEDKKVVIPGYANLREFSAANEKLLKRECGGGWQSYVQRGHWRMIFPFSKRSQERVANNLVTALQGGEPVVVHVVRFPQLSINHAIVLFDVRQTEHEIEFAVYDPNTPDKPTVLTYHRETERFDFPANYYFHGGRVDVYRVYNDLLH